MPPKWPPNFFATRCFRHLRRLVGSYYCKMPIDPFVNGCTSSDESKPCEARVSHGWKQPIQFRVSEPKSPVNRLINRAFFGVVVMGGIDGGHPWPPPSLRSGALRASKIASCDFVNHLRCFRFTHHQTKKRPARGRFVVWW